MGALTADLVNKQKLNLSGNIGTATVAPVRGPVGQAGGEGPAGPPGAGATTRKLYAQSGADPTGATSSSAALLALAGELTGLGGGMIDLAHPLVNPIWVIDEDTAMPTGVGLTGAGGNVSGAGVTSGTTIKCSGPTARLSFPSGQYGAPVSGFTLDGNADGDPTGILYCHSTQRSFSDITIQNPAGVGLFLDAAQNNNFINVNVIGSVGSVRYSVGTVGVKLDRGAGGNAFIRCEFKNNDISGQFRATAAGAYPVPEQNLFLQCILENSNPAGTTILDYGAGLQNHFVGCLFSANNAITLSAGYVVKIHNDDVPSFGSIPVFDGCEFVGSTHDYDAIYVQGSNATPCSVVVTGRTSVAYCAHVFATDGHTRGDIANASWNLSSGTTLANFYNALSGGSFATWYSDRYGGSNYKLSSGNPYAVIVGEDVDASQRMILTRDGTLVWTNGSNQNVGASLTYDETDFAGEKAIRALNLRSDGRLARTLTTTIMGAANAAVTIDAQATSHHFISMAGAGNVTGITINNPTSGSRLTISIAQAGGGKTYVWPINCVFKNNAPPSDTTATSITSVEFIYMGGSWYEISRAENASAAANAALTALVVGNALAELTSVAATARGNIGASAVTQVTEFTAAQTLTPYAVPAGAKWLRIRCMGSGGGGGSGARVASGTAGGGGGSGSSSSYTEIEVPVSALPGTIYVTVGAGATGGAAVGADSTAGSPGGAGNASGVYSTNGAATQATVIAYAAGGSAGGGGTAAAGGAAGAVNQNGRYFGVAGAVGGYGAAGAVGSALSGGAPSGGAGGGISTTPAAFAGGAGVRLVGQWTVAPAAGASGGGNGADGYDQPFALLPGASGAGGGSSITGAAGHGGKGGRGAGGGGGGASLNGNASGAGGGTEDGFVEITAIF